MSADTAATIGNGDLERRDQAIVAHHALQAATGAGSDPADSLHGESHNLCEESSSLIDAQLAGICLGGKYIRARLSRSIEQQVDPRGCSSLPRPAPNVSPVVRRVVLQSDHTVHRALSGRMDSSVRRAWNLLLCCDTF